ncbi:MAG: exonuclease SbcCD subunit D [Candidatus Thorarchaeota archaeon]
MTIENYFITKFGPDLVSKEISCSSVKFIHASDIHLGAAQYQNEHRSDDFIQAFQEILELAITHHVDFIILGGDVFTSLEILPEKLIKIVNILRDFKDFTQNSILIIAIEGNHDVRKFSRGVRFEKRGQSWLKLLNSLGLLTLLDADLDADSEEIFKPYNFVIKKGGRIQIKNVVVYGTRYLGEKPISSLSKIKRAIDNENGCFNVLLQHFGIAGQMDNVPGIKLEKIQPLKKRINYLALGHYHKQFILEDWIYNPGSAEAVSSIDNSFKRGVFLVEVLKKVDNFIKKVKVIHLINRNYIWKTICLSFEIRNKKDFEFVIIKKLKSLLNNLDGKIRPTDHRMPILNLVLKGIKPSCKINERDLRKKLCNIFPIIDLRVYHKFRIPIKTLDNYI